MATMSGRYFSNPDEDFVLRGGLPHYYRELPGFLTNSQLTDTTKNLSQHKFSSSKYVDEPQLRGSLRTVSRSLNRVQGDPHRSLLLEDYNNARHPISTHSELNEILRDAMNKNPSPAAFLSPTDWYTKPIHLSSSVHIPMSTDDMLASRYFPVTLGEVKSLEMMDDIRPARGRPRSKSAKGLRQRSKSAGSRKELNGSDRKTLERSFFLTEKAPHIKTSSICFTSPYNEELSKLRLEKLRIEERQYLELKRQAELEKIRGPKPKWYEMKTPEFHQEAQKNNQLLRNSDQWDDLLTYRESLLNATNRLKTALQRYELPVY